MSQISVVHYNPPINNVLQQNNLNNKQNERQVIVLRKPPHILPQPREQQKDEILLTTNCVRKKAKSTKETKPSNTQSISVARRNARERNRVKQVNNGFANLRQHIPNFIAAAFETNSGRGGNKKLSKVETLRMAVEYIRSLEDILNMDADNTDIMDHLAEMPYPSPSSSTSPSLSTHTSSMNYCYQEMSPQTGDEDVLNNCRSSQQQFIKITDSNSFQIIPKTVLENGENLDPMVVDDHLLQDTSLLDHNLEFTVTSQELSYLNCMHTTGSLSPGFYSDSSLSSIQDIKSEPNSYVTVFNTPPEEKHSPRIDIRNESNCDMPVISLKTEHELPDNHKDNYVGVLEWWEQQRENAGG